jgi:hypothetical protein
MKLFLIVRLYLQFFKLSKPFVGKGYLKLFIFHQREAVRYVKFSYQTSVMSREQREAWYLSGEGRTLTFDEGV